MKCFLCFCCCILFSVSVSFFFLIFFFFFFKHLQFTLPKYVNDDVVRFLDFFFFSFRFSMGQTKSVKIYLLLLLCFFRFSMVLSILSEWRPRWNNKDFWFFFFLIILANFALVFFIFIFFFFSLRKKKKKETRTKKSIDVIWLKRTQLMQNTRLNLLITLCGHRSHVVLYSLYSLNTGWMKATRKNWRP